MLQCVFKCFIYPIHSLNLDLHNNAGESALWLALKQLDPAYLMCDDISQYDNTFAAKLIASGANTDILDPRTGNSLLHRAAQESNEAAAVFLVQHRTQPNPKNAQGEAPIHVAAKNGLHQLVEVLLQHGADPNIQTALKPKPASPVPSAAAATPLAPVPAPSRQRREMESPAQPNTALWSVSQSRPPPSHLPPGPALLEPQSPSPLTPPQQLAGGGMMDFDLTSSALSPTALGALSALSATSQALSSYGVGGAQWGGQTKASERSLMSGSEYRRGRGDGGKTKGV